MLTLKIISVSVVERLLKALIQFPSQLSYSPHVEEGSAIQPHQSFPTASLLRKGKSYCIPEQTHTMPKGAQCHLQKD